MARRKNTTEEEKRGTPQPLIAKAGWTKKRRRLENGGHPDAQFIQVSIVFIKDYTDGNIVYILCEYNTFLF